MNNRNQFLTVLGAGRSCQQIQCLVGIHFLVHKWPFSYCAIIWGKGQGISRVSFVRALIPLMKIPLPWTKASLPNTITLGRGGWLGFQYVEFGGVYNTYLAEIQLYWVHPISLISPSNNTIKEINEVNLTWLVLWEPTRAWTLINHYCYHF